MRESLGISEYDGVDIQIKYCDSCGKHYDELIIARLVLVSGQIVYRYLCEDCLSRIKNIINERAEKL